MSLRILKTGMNYHNILHDDMRNGEGLRVVLFVAGCNHHCKGCHNPETWDVNSGIKFDIDAFFEIMNELKKDCISGLTLSGGDPLHPANRNAVTDLCKIVKSEYPNKSIWCYTGYLYEQVKDLPVMQYIDVLVDGEFKKELADVNYCWAGSTNQRVIKICKC